MNPQPDPVDHRQFYRLPWTAADNAMTWLEPTRQCNIRCDACFHTNDPASRKPLVEIERELDGMLARRACDAMLIAGGEPLTHPDLPAIVRLVASRGVKAALVTNGVGLRPERLRALHEAGLANVTFHVDAHQERPGWTASSEAQLNALRQELADMAHGLPGLSCAFNVTVFPDTLDQVPDIVRWAVANVDRVQVLTLIPVRMVHPDDPFSYAVNGRTVDIRATPYVSAEPDRHIGSPEIYARICEVLPDYRFCAWLGGTACPEALKWVLGSHLGTPDRSFGNMGARTMELLQNGSHLLRGRYLAYAHPSSNRQGRLLLALGLVDPELRRAARRYLGHFLRHPAEGLPRLHVQSISAVQPVDILETGERDNCDGCPNLTWWEGRMVRACQLEEYPIFGAPVVPMPRPQAATAR